MSRGGRAEEKLEDEQKKINYELKQEGRMTIREKIRRWRNMRRGRV